VNIIERPEVQSQAVLWHCMSLAQHWHAVMNVLLKHTMESPTTLDRPANKTKASSQPQRRSRIRTHSRKVMAMIPSVYTTKSVVSTAVELPSTYQHRHRHSNNRRRLVDIRYISVHRVVPRIRIEVVSHDALSKCPRLPLNAIERPSNVMFQSSHGTWG